MKIPSLVSRILMIFLLAVGFLVGTALVGIATWGDMETVFFFPPSTADKGLPNLRCPILISSNETGTVYVNYSNPSTYSTAPYVTVTITQGSTIITDDFTSHPTIPPGTTQKLSWVVVPGEAAFRGSLILVRVFINRSYPLPSRDNTCGIVVLNLGGLTGEQVVYGGFLLSLVGMLAGSIWWLRTYKSMPGQRDTLKGGILFVVVLVILGLIASWFGLWFFGLVSFLIVILLIVILLAHFGMDVRMIFLLRDVNKKRPSSKRFRNNN
jgi:hypothetical protein